MLFFNGKIAIIIFYCFKLKIKWEMREGRQADDSHCAQFHNSFTSCLWASHYNCNNIAVQSTHRAAAAVALWLCPSPKLILLIMQRGKKKLEMSFWQIKTFGWLCLWWARKVGVLMKIITIPRTTKKRVKIPAGIEEPFFISFFSFKMNKTLNMQKCHDYRGG